MMNPTYHFARMKELLDEYQPSLTRDSVAYHLEMAERLLKGCDPTEEALKRDQCNAD